MSRLDKFSAAVSGIWGKHPALICVHEDPKSERPGLCFMCEEVFVRRIREHTAPLMAALMEIQVTNEGKAEMRAIAARALLEAQTK